MNEMIYALVEGFKSITKWNIAKMELITGIAFIAVWSIIGYIFWPVLVGFATHLISFIPFSLIKTNGALLLSSLVFIQVVFITFAIIVILLGYFIIKDARKKQYPLYIITIAIAIILFWSFIWFYNHNTIHTGLEKLLLWLPFETVEKTMAYIFILYFIYNLFVVSMLLFVSLFSRKILTTLTGTKIKKNSTQKVILHTFKNSVIFIALSFIAFILLFIPILNVIIQMAIWIWLVQNSFTYDVGSFFYNTEELKELKRKHKISIFIISFMASMFNLIPLLNIFSPFFAEFTIYHYLESQEK